MDLNKVDVFKKMYDGICDIISFNVLDIIIFIIFFIDFEGKDYIRFDEKLGVGGEFGVGEEIDYVLNLLSLGFKGKYFGNDIIYYFVKKYFKFKEKY